MSTSVYITSTECMRLWKEGDIECVDDVFELCETLDRIAKYKFCLGIDPDYYETEYHQANRFHIQKCAS